MFLGKTFSKLFYLTIIASNAFSPPPSLPLLILSRNGVLLMTSYQLCAVMLDKTRYTYMATWPSMPWQVSFSPSLSLSLFPSPVLFLLLSTVPTSLVSVTGGWRLGSLHLTTDSAYYVYLAAFTLLVVPFCFFNFQKTKYLQFFTLGTRNTAFFV
jgi:hypothetical protein